MRVAAFTAVALLAVVTVFQVGLALGRPWGAAAWGGRHRGVLPTRLRVASGIVALVIYPLLMVVVLDSAGVVTLEMPGTGSVAMWVLTGLFGVGALMNLASRSPVERLWAPLVLVIAVCCAIVAAAI